MNDDFAETLNSLMEWWWKWEREKWTDDKAQLRLLRNVFTHAYKFGYCGDRGRQKFKTIQKKWPEAEKALYLMDGEVVEKQLRILSTKSDERDRRITLAVAWWTAWELGFDFHSHGIRRRYVLRRK